MSDELISYVEAIDAELTTILAGLKVFRQLFVHSNERLSLLNDSAGECFSLVRIALRDLIFLSFARLTDPPQTSGRANLCFEQVVRFARGNGLVNLATEIAPQVDSIRQQAEPIRRWRNERLAHLDLKAALGPVEVALPEISGDQLDSLMKDAGYLMNAIKRSLGITEMGYDQVFMFGDGAALVQWIERGKTHLKCEQLAWEIVGHIGPQVRRGV
jgi:hypothetical protein